MEKCITNKMQMVYKNKNKRNKRKQNTKMARFHAAEGREEKNGTGFLRRRQAVVRLCRGVLRI